MTGDIANLPAASALAAVRADAASQQKRAADPAVSAWVSANAGTGKTYVLVRRVLRLLMSGAAAESILCLTFTKAAAAEMSNRLIRELSRWPAMPDSALRGELAGILHSEPSADELNFARCLFAKVLDAPGGLKIMTIHAFCDRVLRRFPLEAGVPPSFTILTDEEKHAALREASDRVLRDAASQPGSPLGKALLTAVAYAAEGQFDELLHGIVGKREQLAALIRYYGDDDDDVFDAIALALRSALGLSADDTPETIIAQQAALATDGLITRAATILYEGKKTDQDTAANLVAARGKQGRERAQMLAAAFLTKDYKPRADSGMITKAIREAHPGLADELYTARDEFAALECKRRAVQVAVATAALFRLADAALQLYEDAKAQRSALDFDSLIAKTAALFNQSDAAAWVLYRLDANLTHILVDEAQDTSPAQWALVQALTTEFFSGDDGMDRQRTLFAVGDEKQSIYGFQGAEPKQFAEMGNHYASRANASGDDWHRAPLTLSFRSTHAVLEAVDLVFADHGRTPGMTASGQAIRHFANREGEGGLVEIWPVEKGQKADPVSAWLPFDEEAGSAQPAIMLAKRIARQIRHWLDDGEELASLGRAVRPGDILILVRKRAPLAAPIVKALKEAGIPVAGADRMRLTEQLAIMDLMVLGDFLLLPRDDLALAALLKSPIFGFDDDDLFAIGHGREGTFWDALQAISARNPAFADAATRLHGWMEAAARQKPFEFYLARLESEGLRRSLIGRLGPEAGDAIDEFLNLALAYEQNETPSLQGFLHWLRISAPEVKRDMEAERDEVRVMTVHGSKGLEANIVFLADTCSARSASRGGFVDLPPPIGAHRAPQIPIWALSGSNLVPQIREASEAASAAEREEYHRLLYVAMTRARDRLYVTGFEGVKARDRGCWYDLISEGLSQRLVEARDAFGNAVRRMECLQAIPAKQSVIASAGPPAGPLPDWASQAVRAEPRLVYVNPSRLEKAAGGLNGGMAGSAPSRPRGAALLRGRLVHRLLELIPALPPEDWAKAGERFLKAESPKMKSAERAALMADVAQILQNPDFGGVFGPGSRAEVALIARIHARGDGGQPIIISGQVDRLILHEDTIHIVDFKSGAAIPASPEATPAQYLAQLAAYRIALKQLFPEKPVRAALLWTEAPILAEIPAVLLNEAEEQLYFCVRAGQLDAERLCHT